MYAYIFIFVNTETDQCASVGMCEHTCTNTVNSYYCSCNDGYQLVNGHSCTGKFIVQISMPALNV